MRKASSPKLACRIRLLLGVTLGLGGGAAAAETPLRYSNDPFHEEPVAVVQATALERVAIGATALVAFADPPKELLEQVGKIRERDLPLFLDSLREAEPEAAASLVDAVAHLLDAENGVPVSQRADAVAAAARRAREVLLPEALRDRPDFVAAVMAKLLLADDGMVEAYEDAAEGERWEYPTGWSALQRVRELWQALPKEHAAAVGEIDEMIAHLAALLPQPEPPELFTGDPEEPEAYVQGLVGFLEVVTDAELYPGRDLGRAAGLVRDVAASGCDAAETGEAGTARERIAIAAVYYRETIRGSLSVLAAEAQETATERFALLREDSEGQLAERACGELLAALEEGRGVLSPAAAR